MNKTIAKAIDLSAMAYQDPADIESALKGIADGFKWVENKDTDTQAFICEDDDFAWCIFRGTEFDNLDDWITNLNCGFIAGPWGDSHHGFNSDVLSVKYDLDGRLLKYFIQDKPIIFTGHSQGAGDTEQYFSYRCYNLDTPGNICIPIAPPRSFSKAAAFTFGSKHGHRVHHVINNNDIVPRVPTRFMGYGHIENRVLNYLDEDGNLHHDISWWDKFKDRVKGRVYDFGEFGTDGVKDHSISEYQRIWKGVVKGS